MICDFTIFSIVFQSYKDNGKVMMKGSMQCNKVYSWKDFCFQQGSQADMLDY